MAQRISTLRNLRTVKALRGQSLRIDLGKVFTGTLTSWMKKVILEDEHIEFAVVENRYLVLTKDKAQDLADTKNSMKGKWAFDVRQMPDGGGEDDEQVIFTGTILFVNNVTG